MSEDRSASDEDVVKFWRGHFNAVLKEKMRLATANKVAELRVAELEAQLGHERAAAVENILLVDKLNEQLVALSGWIPVEDRLPPADKFAQSSDWVSVSRSIGGQDVGYYHFGDWCWYVCRSSKVADDVTHWRPALPAPDRLLVTALDGEFLKTRPLKMDAGWVGEHTIKVPEPQTIPEYLQGLQRIRDYLQGISRIREVWEGLPDEVRQMIRQYIGAGKSASGEAEKDVP